VLVAYDYSHSRLLLLPDDLRLYRAPARSSPLEPELVRIADGVRMAMAIRGLFPPVELVELETGERSWIVDASPYSNFPVWLFDRADGLPQRPTFGFRVIRGRSPAQQPRQQQRQDEDPSGLGWRAALGPDPFQTTPLRWDKREQSELARVRACLVPVPGVKAEDFSASLERQGWLLSAGRNAARTFLEQFSVDEYTNTYRRHLKTVGALQGSRTLTGTTQP
jgi:NTE family protein